MDIIIPTLGKERQKTYSPFLPICPEQESFRNSSCRNYKRKIKNYF